MFIAQTAAGMESAFIGSFALGTFTMPQIGGCDAENFPPCVDEIIPNHPGANDAYVSAGHGELIALANGFQEINEGRLLIMSDARDMITTKKIEMADGVPMIPDEMITPAAIYRMLVDARELLDVERDIIPDRLDAASGPMVEQIIRSLGQCSLSVEDDASSDDDGNGSTTGDVKRRDAIPPPPPLPETLNENRSKSGLAIAFERIGIKEDDFLKILRTQAPFFTRMNGKWFRLPEEKQKLFPGGMFEFLARAYMRKFPG